MRIFSPPQSSKLHFEPSKLAYAVLGGEKILAKSRQNQPANWRFQKVYKLYKSDFGGV